MSRPREQPAANPSSTNGKAPDPGAIEQGGSWRFPPPGPRWAKTSKIANRPFSLPVGIDGLPWRPRMPRLDDPVRADGSLGEWGDPALTPSGPTKGWKGPGDMSVKVYWGSDGETLRVAAEETDNRHANTQKADLIWNGHFPRMGPVIAEDVHWNIGFALTKSGVAFHQRAGEDDTPAKTTEYAVVRDDDDGKGQRCRLQRRRGWPGPMIQPCIRGSFSQNRRRVGTLIHGTAERGKTIG